MKHLLRFSEGVKIDRLRKMLESHLSYLIDYGFIIEIKSNKIFEIKMPNKINQHGNIEEEIFKWIDIKDDLTPLLSILGNKISHVIIKDGYDFENYYKGDEDYIKLLSGELKFTEELYEITSVEIILE